MIEEIKSTDTVNEGRDKMNRNFEFIQKQLDAGVTHAIPQFINFPNAYRGKKDNYTNKRIAIDSIYSYEAYTRPKAEWSYLSEDTKRDLGDDVYCIYIYYAKGASYDSFCAIFWNEKQRDETLHEMDAVMNLYRVKAAARVTVINPSETVGANMGIVIQDLPKI